MLIYFSTFFLWCQDLKPISDPPPGCLFPKWTTWIPKVAVDLDNIQQQRPGLASKWWHHQKYYLEPLCKIHRQKRCPLSKCRNVSVDNWKAGRIKQYLRDGEGLFLERVKGHREEGVKCSPDKHYFTTLPRTESSLNGAVSRGRADPKPTSQASWYSLPW